MSKLTPLFSLGELYISDFLKPDEQPRCPPVEMKLMLDEYGTVCLEKTGPRDCMWGKYWYRSSISNTMKEQLKDVVDHILKVYDIPKNGTWLDIAGNDGFLLSQVPDRCIKINIDPADETFVEESKKRCDIVIQSYFCREVYENTWGQKANVVTCISMFYDLEDPGKFLDDVYEIMHDDGLLCLQLSYTPLMLEQLEFSNICHEHKYYYSFFNLRALLVQHGFWIRDVQLNNCNAGSFRVHAMKNVGNIKKYASQTHRDVCDFRIASLLSYEQRIRLDVPETWLTFFDRINVLKEETLGFISMAKSEGKTIYGYGASTKFNTTLQYFGLDNNMITAIAERSPAKYGTRTVGTNIPIVSEEEMRLAQPDYLIIGPFQFLSEFMEREKEYLELGGKFVCLMPKFEIISK